MVRCRKIAAPRNAGDQRFVSQCNVHREASIEPDENRQLKKHRQAATQRAVVVLRKQLSLRLRLRLHVVGMLLFDFHHLWLQVLHHLRVQSGFARERNHDATDQNGQHDDRDSVAELERDEVEKVQQPQQWFGEPSEPTKRFDFAQAVNRKETLLFGTSEDIEGVRVRFAGSQFNLFDHLERAVDQFLQPRVLWHRNATV